jgi:hypothetical protein
MFTSTGDVGRVGASSLSSSSLPPLALALELAPELAAGTAPLRAGPRTRFVPRPRPRPRLRPPRAGASSRSSGPGISTPYASSMKP